MKDESLGTILSGDPGRLRGSFEEFSRMAVDLDLTDGPPPWPPARQRTIARSVSVTGPGTFLGKATRTLSFEPTDREGWWFDRTDLPGNLPVQVSIRNVWTTGQIVSNIVLRSGSAHNYIRLAEHIIALRLGTAIHNLVIKTDSGDPPLLEGYGRDLLKALDAAGIREVERPVQYYTVSERVTVGGPGGEFLTLAPARPDRPSLHVDCGIHFKSAIGRQRIRFPLTPEIFRLGGEARTNTSWLKMLYCSTIGRLFADIRNLGYSRRNVLIAGRFKYFNKPRLMHNGKSLEAVWHRAALDLLAALALIEEGMFVGDVISYKSGHRLDVQMIRLLYQNDLLRRVEKLKS